MIITPMLIAVQCSI